MKLSTLDIKNRTDISIAPTKTRKNGKFFLTVSEQCFDGKVELDIAQ